MATEYYPKLSARALMRLAAAVAAATFAFGLSSCSGSGSSSEHSSSTTEQPIEPLISLTPNMVGFLKPGTNNTCYKDGARPCAPLIRISDSLSSDYINANPKQSRVEWPLEAFAGKPGDSLNVLCYTNGQLVRPYEGNTSSTYWYEVEVPEQYVLNPAVIKELKEANSPIKTIRQEGQTDIVGHAAIEWFNQDIPTSGVPVCTS